VTESTKGISDREVQISWMSLSDKDRKGKKEEKKRKRGTEERGGVLRLNRVVKSHKFWGAGLSLRMTEPGALKKRGKEEVADAGNRCEEERADHPDRTIKVSETCHKVGGGRARHARSITYVRGDGDSTRGNKKTARQSLCSEKEKRKGGTSRREQKPRRSKR